ncbi:putative alpha/beta hydrolase-3 [Septoria linicola]|nr:putative alpha/beta hydrolase-3 [Septoria linicola]
MLFTQDFTKLSRQEILDLARPTKEYQEIKEIWPPLRIDWHDQQKAVAKLRTQTEVADEMDELDPAVGEEFLKIKARDGYDLTLRIFRSNEHTDPNGPLVVLWHGGGWVIGSPTMVAELARSLCKRFGAIVVTPNYRLAPEHPWPASINDAWDSYDWIRQNAYTKIGGHEDGNFIMGGISAGASMAIAIAHQAQDEQLEPKITGVYSACGSVRPLDVEKLEPQYRERYLSRTQDECINNPVLSKEMTNLMTECAKPDTTSKLYLPLLWPGNESHQGLPRIYQQLCGRDYSRDEGLIFDDILKNNGGQSRVDLYPGLPHCFWIALPYVPEFKQWEKDTITGFRWLLDAK